MAAKIKVKMNSRGARELLAGNSVMSFVNGMAVRGAAAANAMEGTPRIDRGEKFGFTSWTPTRASRRAIARIYATGPTARRRNAANNTILKALGSAR